MLDVAVIGVLVLLIVIYVVSEKIKKIPNEPTEEYPTGEVDTRKRVIISQDTFDSDNFAMVAMAYKMHKLGMIKLLAVDITGNDISDKSSMIFSSLLEMDKSIPIFVNQSPTLDARATNSTAKFDFSYLPNDGINDSQREDSTRGLARVIMEDGNQVTYITGGHLHNLAYLIDARLDIVTDRIPIAVIACGWDDYHSGKPWMNLCEGTTNVTSAGRATNKVFDNFPNNLFVTPKEWERIPRVNYSEIGNEKVKYLARHGNYSNGKSLHMGDTMGLLFGCVGTHWYNNKLFDVRNCKFSTEPYGGLKIVGNSSTNRYVLENPNLAVIKEIFKELLND